VKSVSLANRKMLFELALDVVAAKFRSSCGAVAVPSIGLLCDVFTAMV
jgi:hypothetical protein